MSKDPVITNPETDIAEAEATKKRKQRESLIRTMTLEALFLFFFIAGYFWYIAPKYEEIGTNLASANESISQIADMRENGIPVQAFLTKTAPKNFASETGQSPESREKIAQVMKKDPDSSLIYFDWLNAVVSEESLKKLDASVQEKRDILGNIIPSYSEALPGADLASGWNRITLASFIRYVEERIFKRFGISSYSPLGIDNIIFEKGNSSKSLINIGTFKMSFDFDISNSKLIELLDFIQSSGKLTIEDGKLVASATSQKNRKDPALSNLNNLLVTIESLSIQKPLSDPEIKNHASMTIAFYVKGQNYTSLVEMRSAIGEKVRQTKDAITKVVDSCKNPSNPECVSDAVVTSLGTLRPMVGEIESLHKRIQEMTKNSTVSDVSGEFDKLFAIYASWKILDTEFQREKGIFEKASAPKASKKSSSGK